jgi:hypothetical protein
MSNPKGHLVHGLHGTRAYTAWANMKARCKRGYAVLCPEWEDFQAFYADMGECPPGLMIERKRNAEGYNKDNCEWATRTTQNRNRSTSFTAREVQLVKALWASTKEGTGMRTFSTIVAPLFNRSASGVRKIIKGQRWQTQ